MLFLKLTRSAKRFGARFGWLIAELVFVFLGMYGAFLLERMHDDDMDLLRKRQILQALVDEFEDYEKELGSASSSLDEAYGVPFFSSYGQGDRPFPTPIPYGGMASVNTGIWEAMLQSGGIEVLEVDVIQKVQVFFKKLQDLLDLYSRFERLTEQMILPEMDQDVNFFYQAEGSELRDKYKWYVNSLFTIGMSLRSLSEQATTTKKVLLAEYEKVRPEEEKEIKKISAPPMNLSQEEDVETRVEGNSASDDLENVRTETIEYLIYQSNALAEFFESTKTSYDRDYAIPFFTSYSEGEQPLPFALPHDLLGGINTEPLAELLSAEGVEEILPADLIDSLSQLFKKISEMEVIYQDLIRRCSEEVSNDHNASVYYEGEDKELKKHFQWFPNTLYTLGLALEDCHSDTQLIIASLGGKSERTEPSEQKESDLTQIKPENSVITDLPSPPPSTHAQLALHSEQTDLNETQTLSANTPKSTKADNNATAPLKVELSSKLEPIPKSYDNSEISSHAICESAKKHYWGMGVEIDYIGARKNFLEAANLGNAEASRYLGLIYFCGKGVEKNLQMSFQWFDKAANGGDEIAQKYLISLKAMHGK